MDSNTNGWNSRLINASFTTREASDILSMSRRTTLGDDQMLWDLSINGMYSMKSAYYFAMDNLVDTYHLRLDGNWKSIWSHKGPNKIKIVIWRNARDCLPTRCRLQCKGVLCP